MIACACEWFRIFFYSYICHKHSCGMWSIVWCFVIVLFFVVFIFIFIFVFNIFCFNVSFVCENWPQSSCCIRGTFGRRRWARQAPELLEERFAGEPREISTFNRHILLVKRSTAQLHGDVQSYASLLPVRTLGAGPSLPVGSMPAESVSFFEVFITLFGTFISISLPTHPEKKSLPKNENKI